MADRKERLQSLFAEAIGLDLALRSSYIEEECRGDPDLRKEIDELLIAFDRYGPKVIGVFEKLPLATPPVADSSAAEDPPTLRMTGRQIGPYRIIHKLGEGGMGVVYQAYDTRLDRDVALKFLPQHMNSDEDAKARFKREAQAASALDHPNICTIHDISETEDGQLFIVMAFYHGQTLKYRLNDGPIELDKIPDIVRQIAEGLGAAHEAGIFHRDIKPANIMVTDRGRVKILDFGIAKLVGAMDLTRTGGTLGTIHYMSPEQVRGEPLDQRTDLWALGVVLYQMLTGKRPFDGDFRQAVVYSILNEEPLDEPDERVGLLTGVRKKLLEKDQALRYQNASEVLTDLGFPAGIGHFGTGKREHPLPSWSRTRWLAVGLPAAVATTWLVWTVFGGRLASDPVDTRIPPNSVSDSLVAVMPFSIGGGGELGYLNEGMAYLISIGLQGAGNLHSVDPNSVLDSFGEDGIAIRDPALGREVAARFGAGRFVLGSVTRLGPQIRINASLYDADEQLVRQAEARAPEEERLAAMVDTIVVQLVGRDANEPHLALAPLAEKTTSSFQALKTYLRGESAYRRGQIGEAAEEFRNAVRLDSTFALARIRAGRYSPTATQ